MSSDSRTITHFSVGNRNCCLIEDKDFVMIIDLNKTEDAESSYAMLKPYFREKDGKYYIDVLVITHGDEDHCLGFKKFKEEIDAGNLVIGEIWHQGFDRTVNEDEDKLPEDYLSLKEEIERREDVEDAEFGDVVVQPKAKDTEEDLFEAAEKPEELNLKVLSPFDGDDETSDYDHNDLSLIMNLEFYGMRMLFAGDSSGVYWQDKIIPDLLDDDDYSDYAEADKLVGSHHGSFTFFGKDRDDVREADPEPDNYEALNRINPDELIISAKEQFPTSGDSSGDDPPHYAAYKWYHKWFRDNHEVKEDDKHPDSWHYTSEGTVRLEHVDNEWKWVDDYEVETEYDDDDQEERSHVQESKNGTDKEKVLRDIALKISTGTAATDTMGRVRDIKEVGGTPNPTHRNYGGSKHSL